MVKALADELGQKGVRVNAIAPGVVDTPLTRPIKDQPEWYLAYAAKSALNRWASADEMAGAVIFLASEAASYVTGTVIFVDGCFWHGCPKHATQPKNNAAFWHKKLAGNRRRDALVTRTLRRTGWQVLRVWECELAKRPEVWVRRIQRAWRRRPVAVG